MTDAEKIARLELIIKYANIKLWENGHYGIAIQLDVGLNDIANDWPISNNLDTIVNSYLNEQA